MRKANPRVFATSDEFFNYNYPAVSEIKKAFAFTGDPAAAADNIAANAWAGTAHGNYRSPLYGKQLWVQMNIKPTVFTAMPRSQYIKSGFRILPDFATNAYIPNFIHEAGSQIPDIKTPKIESLRVDPRVSVNEPYSMTLAQQALDGLDDTVNFDAMLEVLQTEFSMRVNGAMCMANYNAKVFDDSATPAEGTTKDLASVVNYGMFANVIEDTPEYAEGIPVAPLDNLISGYNEYVKQGYTGDKGAFAVDLFNIDRHSADASRHMDAYVDCTDSPNEKRQLSADMMDMAVQMIMPYWKDNNMDNKVGLMGYDTIGRIQQMHYQFQRFIGYANYQTTYNGVRTCPGDVVGFGAANFKGIPLIPDKMISKNQDGSGVGKIYFLDTNTVQHSILIPPTFIQDKSYIPRRALTDVATYYMASQTVCLKPRANAKIMNLM